MNERDDIQCLFSLSELSFLLGLCDPFEFVLGFLLGDMLFFFNLLFGEFSFYLFWYLSGSHVERLGLCLVIRELEGKM